MKIKKLNSRIFFLMALAASAVCFVSCASLCGKSKDEFINVASFNLRQSPKPDSSGDKENRWSNRKAFALSLVKYYEFDIMGTQECYKHQLDYILEGMDNYAYIGVGRNDGKEEGEHSAIFYDKNKFELLDSGNFWYSETPDVPSFGWDAVKYKRICTWGKFRQKCTGKKFYFFSSHFDLTDLSKAKSAELLVKKVKEIAGDSNCVVVGDFNSMYGSQPITTLLESQILFDARMESKTAFYGPHYTCHGFKGLSRNGFIIDHIFVSRGIEVEKFAIISDHLNGAYPSDHFPISAKISLK